MREFTCDPETLLGGYSIQALFYGVLVENYRHILQKHHLDKIDPKSWYPLQSMLTVLQDIANTSTDNMMNLVSIGIAVAQRAQLPPEVQHLPLDEFFNFYEKFYPSVHRNGNAGYIRSEKVADNHLVITLDIPYPDDLFYGTMYGYARRFLPPGTSVTVEFDPDVLPKDEGGEKTVIHIEWTLPAAHS